MGKKEGSGGKRGAENREVGVIIEREGHKRMEMPLIPQIFM